MKSLRNIESAGWGVFGIISLVLVGPITYATYSSLYETATASVRIASGILTALVAAAVVTFTINEVLYRAHRKRAEEVRKAERRAKKKKRKRR